LVKRSIVSIVVLGAVLTLALGGCRSREKAVDSATQTIEPATPQPDTDTVALTQTVDVEKGRSEVEGRNANGADITATGDTAAATTTSTTISTTTTGTSATTTTR
jgi:hypothetical protein